jgi:Uncharacterized conserved protein
MSSREKILGRIRSALDAVPGTATLPDELPVWPIKSLSTAELKGQFNESLATAGGEVVACQSREEAAQRLAALLKALNAKKIGIANRGIVRETLACKSAFGDNAADFERHDAPVVANDVSQSEVATFDASIIGAEYLLADTGSAVIVSATAFDRMLCYLPPVCCVVATERMLREHLPATWPELCARVKGEPVDSPDIDTNVPITQNGEFLIVTGPSRTADIEKILVMGVHGPKRLVVFLIADV